MRAASSALRRLEQLAEAAAEQQRRHHRQRAHHVPHRADLPGHHMLLPQRRGQPVLRARDEEERHRQQHHGDEQRPVGDGDEGEERVEPGARRAEQHHVAAVALAEGAPDVAQEAEDPGEIERNAGHDAEIGDLLRRQVQLVLEEEADRDVDQPAIGRAEGEEEDERAEIEEDAPAHPPRQDLGSDRHGRVHLRRMVDGHRSPAPPGRSSPPAVPTPPPLGNRIRQPPGRPRNLIHNRHL